MRSAGSVRVRCLAWCLGIVLLPLPLHPLPGAASPYEYLPVNDPLEAELRILDILGPTSLGRLRLLHQGTRPVQRFELDSLPDPDRVPDRAQQISLRRLYRVLARDREPQAAPGSVAGLTPRLYQRRYPDQARFEISAGLEGGLRALEGETHAISGTGLRGRVALETERWLAFSHLIVGYVDTARTFGDPLIAGTDIIVHSEESYLGYTGAGGRWGVQFGRNRWHWGPGQEGSLMLSRTSVPLTGLAFHARLEALRIDGTVISATIRPSGEQLAAHRIEWQALDGLRLGVSEAARYKSDAWQPLYLAGILPYIMVQRLHNQDESDIENRNNVMIGMDVAWRIAPGTRVYGEWLVDDLHASSGANPNKYAIQLGWEGVGIVRGTRLSWGGEYTRLTQFLYTSFFGRDYVAQGVPLGFPIAPDARRMRVRAVLDLSPAWQISTHATRTEKGENTLDQPFVSGSPRVDAAKLSGVVEETRELEAGLRWWPAGGIDVALTGAYHWIDDAGHVPGARDRGARGALAVRLVR